MQPLPASDKEPAASIAGARQEMTGLSDVDPDDDFFEPGSSLIATCVVARLRAARGVDAPLRTFFQNPTVARRADALRLTLVRPAAAGPADDHECDVP